MVTYVRVQGYISYDGWFIEEEFGSFPHPFLPHILILAIYFRCSAMIHLLIIFLLLFVFTKNSESSSPLSSSFSHLISFNFFMYLSVPLKFQRSGGFFQLTFFFGISRIGFAQVLVFSLKPCPYKEMKSKKFLTNYV